MGGVVHFPLSVLRRHTFFRPLTFEDFNVTLTVLTSVLDACSLCLCLTPGTEVLKPWIIILKINLPVV